MTLEKYTEKRDFTQTREPASKKHPEKVSKTTRSRLKFVVQRHHASRLHYDFRLEMDGVLKSWAVPKGPSLNPKDKRLAMMVEDHPYDYRTFEGTIPAGNYGAGVVAIFDHGTYEALDNGKEKELLQGLHKGNLKFKLHGKILKGEFALVKISSTEQNAWLLIKHNDDYAVKKSFNSEQLVSAAVKKKGLDFKKETKKAPSSNEKLSKTIVKGQQSMGDEFAAAVFNEKDWEKETTYGGNPALAYTNAKGEGKVLMRDQLSAKKTKPIAAALKKMGLDALIDGELVEAQNKFKFYVADLIALNGHDIRNMDQEKRKELLQKIIESLNSPLVIYPKNMEQKENEPAEKVLAFGSKKLKLTNLNKIYWPEERITKGQLIAYYEEIAAYILPHLKDKPLSLNRHPNGIKEPGFFQKDLDTDKIPAWIKSAPLHSESNDKDIDYLICNDKASLLWMVNLGCIEINPWLSKYKKPDTPLCAVLDLDPYDIDFKEVVKVALAAKKLLDKMKLSTFIKTSGSKGLHIFIPIGEKYDYNVSKDFINYLGEMLLSKFPETTSLERSPAKRKNKIYLDFLQNRRGQTIAAPYAARPKPGATVSTPLEWEEVNENLNLKDYTIFNMPGRLKEKGDLWKRLLTTKNDIFAGLKKLRD